MQTDDNGNDVELKRVMSRCEAATLVREFEARPQADVLDRGSLTFDSMVIAVRVHLIG